MDVDLVASCSGSAISPSDKGGLFAGEEGLLISELMPSMDASRHTDGSKMKWLEAKSKSMVRVVNVYEMCLRQGLGVD